MKFLVIPMLDRLSAFISGQTIGVASLSCTIECYSCKPAGEDKKLGKALHRQYSKELEQDPTSPILTATPIGNLHDTHTQRLLINLISTLNATFPDYDFSTSKPEEFYRVAIATAVQTVNKALAEVLQADGKPLLDQLWGAIDSAVTLRDCDVYAYIPDLDCDPFSSSSLWSFNYFFHNKSAKKILFFFAMAQLSTEGDLDVGSVASISPYPEVEVMAGAGATQDDDDLDVSDSGSEV